MIFKWTVGGDTKTGRLINFVFVGTDIYAMLINLSDGKIHKILYTELTAENI